MLQSIHNFSSCPPGISRIQRFVENRFWWRTLNSMSEPVQSVEWTMGFLKLLPVSQQHWPHITPWLTMYCPLPWKLQKLDFVTCSGLVISYRELLMKGDFRLLAVHGRLSSNIWTSIEHHPQSSGHENKRSLKTYCAINEHECSKQSSVCSEWLSAVNLPYMCLKCTLQTVCTMHTWTLINCSVQYMKYTLYTEYNKHILKCLLH